MEYQAIPRPSSVGEFIEFATGREALKLVGDLRLSQAVSRALYDPYARVRNAAEAIADFIAPVPARKTDPSAP